MKGFLDYLQGDSILHKMHPLTKILVAALLCASAFVSSNFFYLLGIIIFDVFLGVIGEGKSHSGLLKRTLGIFKGLFKMSLNIRRASLKTFNRCQLRFKQKYLEHKSIKHQ